MLWRVRIKTVQQGDAEHGSLARWTSCKDPPLSFDLLAAVSHGWISWIAGRIASRWDALAGEYVACTAVGVRIAGFDVQIVFT